MEPGPSRENMTKTDKKPSGVFKVLHAILQCVQEHTMTPGCANSLIEIIKKQYTLDELELFVTHTTQIFEDFKQAKP